jgi:hypothetical protein
MRPTQDRHPGLVPGSTGKQAPSRAVDFPFTGMTK